MKIIFDLGFNNGQNFDYFLMKSDVVIGFDANKNVYNKVSEKYKFHIKNGSLRYHLKRLFPSFVKMLKYCRSNLFKN